MRKLFIFTLLLVSCTHVRAQMYPADSNWVIQDAGTSELLKSVFFKDSVSGWIGGEKSVFYTKDAGNNWIRIDSVVEEDQTIQDVFVINENHIWKITRTDTIIDTTGTNAYISKILFSGDNGANWSVQFKTTEYILEKIYFIDTLKGFVIGSDGLVMRTTNAGQTWTLTTTEEVLLQSIYFLNDTSGWIAGEQSTLMKTTDGGENWSIFVELPDYAAIQSIFFTDDQNGWLGGNVGRLFSTNDGGESWTVHQFEYEDYFYDIYFKNNIIGWACSANGRLHYTTDGDTIWTSTEIAEYSLRDMHFVDEDRGWIVGNNGLILHTINGGGEVGIPENTIIKDNLIAAVYPNPVNDRSVLEIKNTNSDSPGITLNDFSGHTLFADKIFMNGQKTKTIDLTKIFRGIHTVSPGIYFIRIYDQNSQKVIKIIKPE